MCCIVANASSRIMASREPVGNCKRAFPVAASASMAGIGQAILGSQTPRDTGELEPCSGNTLDFSTKAVKAASIKRDGEEA